VADDLQNCSGKIKMSKSSARGQQEIKLKLNFSVCINTREIDDENITASAPPVINFILLSSF
jgi:hypothetical protein